MKLYMKVKVILKKIFDKITFENVEKYPKVKTRRWYWG